MFIATSFCVSIWLNAKLATNLYSKKSNSQEHIPDMLLLSFSAGLLIYTILFAKKYIVNAL